MPTCWGTTSPDKVSSPKGTGRAGQEASCCPRQAIEVTSASSVLHPGQSSVSLCPHQLLGAAAEHNWEIQRSEGVGSLPQWQAAQMLFNILCIALINSWGTLTLIRSAWQSWLEQRHQQNLSLIRKAPTQGWKCQTYLYQERGELLYEKECYQNILHFQLLLWLCPSQHRLLPTHTPHHNLQKEKNRCSYKSSDSWANTAQPDLPWYQSLGREDSVCWEIFSGEQRWRLVWHSHGCSKQTKVKGNMSWIRSHQQSFNHASLPQCQRFNLEH